MVPRPTDPLQSLSHRARRLDLDHQIDRAHVDPELERAGGYHRREPARLEVLLDQQALLLANRPVMGTGDLLSRNIVDPGAQSLGQPPGVRKDDGAAVLTDQLDQVPLDVRPHAAPLRWIIGRATGSGPRFEVAGGAEILDRHNDRKIEPLLAGWGDHLDRPAARKEPSHLVEGPYGGGQPDALGGVRE